MSYLDEKGVNKLWSKAKEKFATTSDVSGKANLAGNNTFTGGQTITGNNNGYSVNASGYVKGSWLQAPSTGKASSNTGKVCVLDSSGWIYYRTPAEIVSDGGGSDGGGPYYLHTMRALTVGSNNNYIVFSVISTQSTAYSKESLYSAFPNKNIHASGYYNYATKANYRVNAVTPKSTTTIQIDYGSNEYITLEYGGTYFTDDVIKII